MNLNATLFAQTVVFFVLVWVVARFIWPHLDKALEDRQKKIADGLAAADRGTKSLEEARKKIAQLEAEARAQAQGLLADTEKRAQAIIDEAKAAAKSEADRLVASAKQDAQQEVVRAKNDLRDQVAVLAVAGAEQILQREVNAQVHAQLLDQLKAKL